MRLSHASQFEEAVRWSSRICVVLQQKLCAFRPMSCCYACAAVLPKLFAGACERVA